MIPIPDTNFRIIGTAPSAAYTGRALAPGELARIIGRQCAVSFDVMQESFTRNDNRRWVPREQQEDYEERYEAGAACDRYESPQGIAARMIGLGLGVAAVLVLALLIGRAG